MKTEIELNEDIIKITKTIKETHPELVKYISEMPIHINYENNKELDITYLQEHLNSLHTLLKNYSNAH